MNTARDQHGGDTGLEARVWSLLGAVPDPEIPVLTITDLGIVRWVRTEGGRVIVGLTPTYTGCPATEVIEASVLGQLRRNGVSDVRVERVLTPAWTTEWITDAGRDKLLAYGIVPPHHPARSTRALVTGEPAVACPRCAATKTRKVSEFGSTPCKSAWKCDDCLEPFEYFKCL